MKIQKLQAQLTSTGVTGVVIAILFHIDATGNETAVMLFVESQYGQVSEQPAANVKLADPTCANLILG